MDKGALTSTLRRFPILATLLLLGTAACGQGPVDANLEDGFAAQGRAASGPRGPTSMLAVWTPAGSLLEARSYPTATRLDTGDIFVQGGWGETALLNSAELYHPATDTWSSAGTVPHPREYPVAAALPGGKALVIAGGCNGTAFATTEIYDSTTNSWSTVSPMHTGRCSHSATTLADGRVLIAGGWPYVLTAEIYDPATNQWSLTAPMKKTRAYHVATLLPNGKVLVAGGQGTLDNNDAEIYDPATDNWTLTGTNSYYDVQTLTPLPDGRVLASFSYWAPGSRVDIWSPSTNTWSPGPAMTTLRTSHTATLLQNGKVLVAGGFCDPNSPACDVNGGDYDPTAEGDPTVYLRSAELFDPATNTWTATTSMISGRVSHQAFRLGSGKVLAIGGVNPYAALYDSGRAPGDTDPIVFTTWQLGSTELYTPAADWSGCAGIFCNPRSLE